MLDSLELLFYRCGPLNYDAKYQGATSKPPATLTEDNDLSKDGFFVNHARVLLGSGIDTYERGKSALMNWRCVSMCFQPTEAVCGSEVWSGNWASNCRHFGLNWAFVDPKTPIQKGVKFCACTKASVPWLVMPLEVVYVNDTRKSKKAVASFSFGSGTLRGHPLVRTPPTLIIILLNMGMGISPSDVVSCSFWLMNHFTGFFHLICSNWFFYNPILSPLDLIYCRQ